MTPSYRPRLELLEDRCVPATFTVKNLNDDGPGSLRQAVADANATAVLDEIVFKKGLEGTIHLTTGEIAITEDLKITGRGAKKIAVSGNFSSRILNIDGGAAGADLNVTIKGLELRHGVTNGAGGAILSQENLSLVSMVFTQSRSDNTGGAIASFGTLTLKNSTVTGNHTTNFGGGISGFAVTITGSTIAGNSALEGGGIDCATAIITGSTIVGNSAVVGGGILCNTATITGSTIAGNSAETQGGGIRCSGSVTITGSTITGNSAGTIGGGIFCAIATITGSTIAGNRAGTEGGGLWMLGSLASQIRNTTFSGNQAGTNGGGIWSSHTDLALRNCTIAFNRADQEGGGMFVENSDAVLESCLVADNDATGTDRDIENGTGGSFTVTHCLIGLRDDAAITDDGTNLIGTGAVPIDPRLAPLANNGGKTQTHALKKGSPAINQGSNSSGLKKDQRGGKFLRKVGGVDIGAFERQ